MPANAAWPVSAQSFRDSTAVVSIRDRKAVDSIRGELPAVYPDHES